MIADLSIGPINFIFFPEIINPAVAGIGMFGSSQFPQVESIILLAFKKYSPDVNCT